MLRHVLRSVSLWAMETVKSRKKTVKCFRAGIYAVIEKNGERGRDRTLADKMRSAYALSLVNLMLD